MLMYEKVHLILFFLQTSFWYRFLCDISCFFICFCEAKTSNPRKKFLTNPNVEKDIAKRRANQSFRTENGYNSVYIKNEGWLIRRFLDPTCVDKLLEAKKISSPVMAAPYTKFSFFKEGVGTRFSFWSEGHITDTIGLSFTGHIVTPQNIKMAGNSDEGFLYKRIQFWYFPQH